MKLLRPRMSYRLAPRGEADSMTWLQQETRKEGKSTWVLLAAKGQADVLQVDKPGDDAAGDAL